MGSQLVTVYIPTKNRLDLLNRAVSSVLAQTYNNIEIIIVDDGSSCEVRHEIKQKYKFFEKIKILFTENKGACTARNLAIKLGKGEFITGLDDDDIFLPTRIQTFLEHWDDKYVALCAKQISIKSKRKIAFSNYRVINLKQLLKENIVGNQVFTKIETLRKFTFDESLPALQDWELWLRLTLGGRKICKLNMPLQIIDNQHGEARISNIDRRLKALNIIKKKNEYKGLSFDNITRVWEFEENISLFTAIKSRSFNSLLIYLRKRINEK